MAQCGSNQCISPDTYCNIPSGKCLPCKDLCNPRNFDTLGENHLGSCFRHCKEFYDRNIIINPQTDDPHLITATVSQQPINPSVNDVINQPHSANLVHNSTGWNANTTLSAIIGPIVLLVLIVVLAVYITRKWKINKNGHQRLTPNVVHLRTNDNIPGNGDVSATGSEGDGDNDTYCKILMDSPQHAQGEDTQVKTNSSEIQQESAAATGSDDVAAAAAHPLLISHTDPDVTVATTYPPEEDTIWCSNNGAPLQHPADMNEETGGFSQHAVDYKRVQNEMEQGVSNKTSGYGSAGLNCINSIS